LTFSVILTPEAQSDLQQIQDYIVSKSFPDNAAKYLSRLLDHLDGIGSSPFRGTLRTDIGPGFRTTGFERRATILYAIRGEDVIIAGVYFGGQQVPKSYRL